MTKLILSLVLVTALPLAYSLANHAEVIAIVPIVETDLQHVSVEVTSLQGTHTIQLKIKVPHEADIWVSMYAENGQMIRRDRLHGQELQHYLHLDYLSGDTFQVNVSYVYGGLLHVAKIHRKPA